jgi:signal transduction histidine kinase/CheY-like chemotaxis protein
LLAGAAAGAGRTSGGYNGRTRQFGGTGIPSERSTAQKREITPTHLFHSPVKLGYLAGVTRHLLNWLSFPHGKPRPLRFHFALLVCGVLFPVVAFSVVVLRQLAASEQEAAERRLLLSAHDLASSVDRELNGTIRALQVLADAQSLESGNLDVFYDEVKRISNPNWSHVILTDDAGKVLLSTRQPLGSPSPRVIEPESLARLLAEKKPVIGYLTRGPEGALAFPVRIPISYHDRLRYTLTAVVRAEMLAPLVAAPNYALEWTRTIVDARGTVVARTRDPARFVGQAATPSFLQHIRSSTDSTYRDATLEGARGFVSFSRAPASDWTAIVVVPVETVDGPAFRFLLTATLVGVALLVASGIGAFVLTRRVSRGIADAVTAADALSLGRRPTPPRSPVAEIDRLFHALRQSADLLELRDRERRENLLRAQEALATAEEANRAKDDFLAMLGHELRNPLGPLRNSVHLLHQFLPEGEEPRAVVEIIERQVHHMTRLVDELLDASRVGRGAILLQLTVLDLARLVQDVTADYRVQFEAAGLALPVRVPDHPVYVEGDRTRIAQCLGNLLHNALKFTPAGGTVSVSLFPDDPYAAIEVSDTGPGIPPELLPKLFEAFSQGPQNLARMQGGLGLGLALVRGLAQLHGGDVSARSRGIGKGATFVLRLPVTTKQPPQQVASLGGADALPTTQRILVVEDLPDAARSLKMLLAIEGHKVDTAPTAADALQRAPQIRPSVIICDIGLPDMDGYELCRRLKLLPELQSTRFIALTGYGQASDVSRALDAGFNLHLTKPVDIAALHDALRQTVENRPAGNVS